MFKYFFLIFLSATTSFLVITASYLIFNQSSKTFIEKIGIMIVNPTFWMGFLIFSTAFFVFYFITLRNWAKEPKIFHQK